MSATHHTIVTCIEVPQGIDAQAKEGGPADDVWLLEWVADCIRREKARLAKEAIAAFGAEVDGKTK